MAAGDHYEPLQRESTIYSHICILYCIVYQTAVMQLIAILLRQDRIYQRDQRTRHLFCSFQHNFMRFQKHHNTIVSLPAVDTRKHSKQLPFHWLDVLDGMKAVRTRQSMPWHKDDSQCRHGYQLVFMHDQSIALCTPYLLQLAIKIPLALARQGHLFK